MTNNFILQAIAEKTEQEEQCRAFHDDAEARHTKIIATGETIPCQEIRAYLEGRMAWKTPSRPVARNLSR